MFELIIFKTHYRKFYCKILIDGNTVKSLRITAALFDNLLRACNRSRRNLVYDSHKVGVQFGVIDVTPEGKMEFWDL